MNPESWLAKFSHTFGLARTPMSQQRKLAGDRWWKWRNAPSQVSVQTAATPAMCNYYRRAHSLNPLVILALSQTRVIFNHAERIACSHCTSYHCWRLVAYIHNRGESERERRGCKKGFERRNKCALPYMSKAHARHQSHNLPIQSAHQKCAAPAPALCYLFLLDLSDVHIANWAQAVRLSQLRNSMGSKLARDRNWSHFKWRHTAPTSTLNPKANWL